MAKTAITPLFDKIKADIAALEADVAKADKGQAAAGVRVRKGMQQLKNEAQDIRLALVEK